MWYLESLDKEEIVFTYLSFSQEKIKKDMFNFFRDNPLDELWFYKEDKNRNTVGDDFICVFVHTNKGICKEIYKGNKTFLKSIN